MPYKDIFFCRWLRDKVELGTSVHLNLGLVLFVWFLNVLVNY